MLANQLHQLQLLSKTMEHFADFGYVKQANKQLKRLNESKNLSIGALQGDGLGEKAQDAVNRYFRTGTSEAKKIKIAKGYENILNGSLRHSRAEIKPQLDPLTKKYRKTISNYIPENPSSDKWSDIRKTDDYAASNSGYLGFRTDPFKGYGGMMEEPVPKNDITLKNRSVIKGKIRNLDVTDRGINYQ